MFKFPTAKRQLMKSENGTPPEKTGSALNPSSDMELAGHPAHIDFPEGGVGAWMVAASASGILFCTFGYLNAFG